MTRQEFIQGWMLLVIQPWGKQYAGTETAAKLQQELYWSRLARFHGEAWIGACQVYASGHKWPSVDDLKQNMNNSLPPRLQITNQADQTEKPEILVKLEVYQKEKNCTVLEAAEYVLPLYAKEHPEPEADEDIAQCEQLIKSLKAHRASMQVLKQERAAQASA